MGPGDSYSSAVSSIWQLGGNRLVAGPAGLYIRACPRRVLALAPRCRAKRHRDQQRAPGFRLCLAQQVAEAALPRPPLRQGARHAQLRRPAGGPAPGTNFRCGRRSIARQARFTRATKDSITSRLRPHLGGIATSLAQKGYLPDPRWTSLEYSIGWPLTVLLRQQIGIICSY